MMYRVVWLLLALPLRWAFRLKVEGRENVPAGAFVLSGNHVSYLDPIMLAVSLIRPVHFMAKIELFEKKWFALVLRSVKAFPVVRHTPDRHALAKAGELLARGRIVGIFPEGTRSESGGGEGHGGAALVAMRAGVPVIPVGIAGTEEALPRGASRVRFPRVSVSFGVPLKADDAGGAGRKERVETLTQAIMESIAEARSRADDARRA